jgi:hypothetical protein
MEMRNSEYMQELSWFISSSFQRILAAEINKKLMAFLKY